MLEKKKENVQYCCIHFFSSFLSSCATFIHLEKYVTRNLFFNFLGEDTTMRFSLTPCPGEKAFQQWKDAIAVAIRMPEGLPSSIRQKVINE